MGYLAHSNRGPTPFVIDKTPKMCSSRGRIPLQYNKRNRAQCRLSLALGTYNRATLLVKAQFVLASIVVTIGDVSGTDPPPLGAAVHNVPTTCSTLDGRPSGRYTQIVALDLVDRWLRI